MRDISSHDSEGYPYTYPVIYANEEGSRDIKAFDTDGYPYNYPFTYAKDNPRNIKDPT